MIAFIDEHRAIYGVEPICRVLPIAPSTYRLHAARQRDPSLLPDRARRDLVLMEEIERVFETNYSVYGARKVSAFARRIVGWRVSRTAHAGFVLDALEQAIHARKPASGSASFITAAGSNTCRSNTPSAWPKPGSILRSAVSATATTTRCRNDQRPLQGRSDPPARPVEIVRGRRIRHPRMGRLVQ